MSRSSSALSLGLPGDNDDIARRAEEDQRDRDAFDAVTRTSLNGRNTGLVLGIGLAVYLRREKTRLFEAMKIAERPIAVVLPNGKAEHLPDLAPFLKASKLRTVATYGVCGIGAAVLGGLVGSLVGMSGGWRQDHEARRRAARGLAKFWAKEARK
ncbi:MAG: hypothetical protein OHK93_003820 [Ramalina farinacea]|uniref:Uncharacterized protein n=1 Tax=Ramalina farinacea TaxID=258253 RepID=A0AA43QFJ7_9LECA|nr:hypothetical protein [Ramalina farinacea]